MTCAVIHRAQFFHPLLPGKPPPLLLLRIRKEDQDSVPNVRCRYRSIHPHRDTPPTPAQPLSSNSIPCLDFVFDTNRPRPPTTGERQTNLSSTSRSSLPGTPGTKASAID